MKLSDLPPFSLGNTIQMVAAVYAGEGLVLVCPFPGEESDEYDYTERLQVLQLSADDWAEFLRRTDLMEVEVTDGIRKAIVRKTQRQIDASITWQCFRRDGYRCCYCGADQVPLTVDHLVLWEEGGPSIPANLLTACKRCNRTRGNTQYADWLASEYYQRVSMGVAPERLDTNEALADTLGGIRRENRVRSR